MVFMIMFGIPPPIAFAITLTLTILALVAGISAGFQQQKQIRNPRAHRTHNLNGRDVQAARRMARGQTNIFDANRLARAPRKLRRRR